MPIIDAAVMAGGVPGPTEELWSRTKGRPKALLPIGGQSMVQWVLDAVGAAPTIRNVSIVGLEPQDPPQDHPPEQPQTPALRCAKPMRYVAGTGSFVGNMQAAGADARAHPDPPTYLLTVGSDIPTITPAVIEWATTAPLASNRDAYGFLVSLATLQRRFPGPHRDLLRLVDGHWVMGDLALFKLAVLADVHPAWQSVLAARKSVLTMARLVGADVLVRLLFRRLRREHLEDVVRNRLGIDAEIVTCPFAEAAMDVDRTDEYETLLRDFERRRHGGGTEPGQITNDGQT